MAFSVHVEEQLLFLGKDPMAYAQQTSDLSKTTLENSTKETTSQANNPDASTSVGSNFSPIWIAIPLLLAGVFWVLYRSRKIDGSGEDSFESGSQSKNSAASKNIAGSTSSSGFTESDENVSSEAGRKKKQGKRASEGPVIDPAQAQRLAQVRKERKKQKRLANQSRLEAQNRAISMQSRAHLAATDDASEPTEVEEGVVAGTSEPRSTQEGTTVISSGVQSTQAINAVRMKATSVDRKPSSDKKAAKQKPAVAGFQRFDRKSVVPRVVELPLSGYENTGTAKSVAMKDRVVRASEASIERIEEATPTAQEIKEARTLRDFIQSKGSAE